MSIYQSICQCPMPLFGMIRGNGGVAGIVTSGQCDGRICISTAWGPRKEYAIDPAFTLRSVPQQSRLADDIAVQYHFLPANEASWLDVGKRYREYNLSQRSIGHCLSEPMLRRRWPIRRRRCKCGYGLE